MTEFPEDLPELTDEERKAMESIDLTPVLGTWEERHNVVMNAAKRLLRDKIELRKALDIAHVSYCAQNCKRAHDTHCQEMRRLLGR